MQAHVLELVRMLEDVAGSAIHSRDVEELSWATTPCCFAVARHLEGSRAEGCYAVGDERRAQSCCGRSRPREGLKPRCLLRARISVRDRSNWPLFSASVVGSSPGAHDLWCTSGRINFVGASFVRADKRGQEGAGACHV